MNLKESLRRFQRAMARYALYFFFWLFSKLSYESVIGMTDGMFGCAYPLLIRQKKIAEKSLKIAFRRGKTQAEIEDIMRRCFRNLGQGMVEMLYFLSHPQVAHEKISFEGREHLDFALAQGNGVVAVTAHFGNFPLMMLACALEGYKTNSIIRPMRDLKVEEFFQRKRTESGLNTVYAVPRRECVNNSLKALRNNEILFIPLDQNFGSDGGVYVDFFGQKAATATGPVVFAKRTKALILPMFIIREPNDHHKIIIEPPLTMEDGKDEEETILNNTARITKIIEQYIRRYPYEWGWMHRRWKSRPYFSRYLPNA